jgi:hypothetical protein
MERSYFEAEARKSITHWRLSILRNALPTKRRLSLAGSVYRAITSRRISISTLLL